MASEPPTDRELTEYITSLFREIAPQFAEPQAVADAVAYDRDLWVRLYELDREAESGDIADPS